MQKKSFFVPVLWLVSATIVAHAQQVADTKHAAPLNAEKEKRALQSLSKIAEKEIISAVDAMPADKFGFAPTDGEFKGVRTFGQMVKHFSATNHILAAAALGEEPPADAGDELGPENVRTKAEIGEVTRSALIVGLLVHAFDHYGQMVEYLRMNGVVPPASRP